jgi:hypothetical protein
MRVDRKPEPDVSPRFSRAARKSSCRVS